MPQRLAGAMSLVVFTFCLLIGGFGADNSFGTVVGRAMVAMMGTFFIALIIGLMARKMIEENLGAATQARALKKIEENVENKSRPSDR